MWQECNKASNQIATCQDHDCLVRANLAVSSHKFSLEDIREQVHCEPQDTYHNWWDVIYASKPARKQIAYSGPVHATLVVLELYRLPRVWEAATSQPLHHEVLSNENLRNMLSPPMAERFARMKLLPRHNGNSLHLAGFVQTSVVPHNCFKCKICRVLAARWSSLVSISFNHAYLSLQKSVWSSRLR